MWRRVVEERAVSRGLVRLGDAPAKAAALAQKLRGEYGFAAAEGRALLNRSHSDRISYLSGLESTIAFLNSLLKNSHFPASRKSQESPILVLDLEHAAFRWGFGAWPGVAVKSPSPDWESWLVGELDAAVHCGWAIPLHMGAKVVVVAAGVMAKRALDVARRYAQSHPLNSGAVIICVLSLWP